VRSIAEGEDFPFLVQPVLVVNECHHFLISSACTKNLGTPWFKSVNISGSSCGGASSCNPSLPGSFLSNGCKGVQHIISPLCPGPATILSTPVPPLNCSALSLTRRTVYDAKPRQLVGRYEQTGSNMSVDGCTSRIMPSALRTLRLLSASALIQNLSLLATSFWCYLH